MAVSRFVVYAPDLEEPWKVFTTRTAAHEHASRVVAEVAREATIYESPDLEDVPEGKRTYAAKAAVEHGEGLFIEKKVRMATEEQLRKAAKRFLWELGL
jgi:uncharacterized Rossmann fold enzyme